MIPRQATTELLHENTAIIVKKLISIAQSSAEAHKPMSSCIAGLFTFGEMKSL